MPEIRQRRRGPRRVHRGQGLGGGAENGSGCSVVELHGGEIEGGGRERTSPAVTVGE